MKDTDTVFQQPSSPPAVSAQVCSSHRLSYVSRATRATRSSASEQRSMRPIIAPKHTTLSSWLLEAEPAQDSVDLRGQVSLAPQQSTGGERINGSQRSRRPPALFGRSLLCSSTDVGCRAVGSIAGTPLVDDAAEEETRISPRHAVDRRTTRDCREQETQAAASHRSSGSAFTGMQRRGKWIHCAINSEDFRIVGLCTRRFPCLQIGVDDRCTNGRGELFLNVQTSSRLVKIEQRVEED